MFHFSFKILDAFLRFCFYYQLSGTRNKPYANLARCNWFLLHAGQLAALHAFLFISDRFPNLRTEIVAFASRRSIVNIPAPRCLAFRRHSYNWTWHKLLRAIDRSEYPRELFERWEKYSWEGWEKGLLIYRANCAAIFCQDPHSPRWTGYRRC